MNEWKQKLKLRLPVFILLLATVLFWTSYDRYEPAGPLLLEAPSLADGVNVRGEISAADGRFVLNVPRGGKSARINFRLPDATDYEMIRVRARIKVDGVMVGKYSWSCARLLLTQYDVHNKWMSGLHGLVAEKGTKDWEPHEDVFEIFSGADRADVVLQQSGIEGVAEFDRIEAQPVRLRASFVWWRTLFIVLWLLSAILYFSHCRLKTRRLKVLIVLNVIVILFGTLLPGEWISDASEKVKTVFREMQMPDTPAQKSPPPTEKKAPAPTPLQKQIDGFMAMEVEAHRVGHFMLFASLCFLVYCSAALERQHPIYFFKVGFDILIFAAVTEALQFLTIDRTAGILDLRTDLYGMALAIVLFLLVRPLLLKRA